MSCHKRDGEFFGVACTIWLGKIHLRMYAAAYREACEVHGEICNQVGKRCGYQPLMILTMICLIDFNTRVSEYI